MNSLKKAVRHVVEHTEKMVEQRYSTLFDGSPSNRSRPVSRMKELRKIL